jgi:hypothetical protein
MVRRGARRSPIIDNREASKGETTADSGIHSLETAATGLLPSPSGLHGRGNQSRAGMRRCLGAHSLAGRPGIPHPRGIHRPGDRGERSILRRLGIRSSAEQDGRGIPRLPGIHRSEDRSNREHRNNLGIHTPVAGRTDIDTRDNRNPDTRSQENIRRPGSRNRCPVAAEVWSRRLRISRLPLRPPPREPLPARRPPLLQSQHQRPPPIDHRQSRVGRDRMGSRKPRGPNPTRQSHRVQIGSFSLALRRSTEPNRITTTVTSHPFSRRIQRFGSASPNGLQRWGCGNSLAEP